MLRPEEIRARMRGGGGSDESGLDEVLPALSCKHLSLSPTNPSYYPTPFFSNAHMLPDLNNISTDNPPQHDEYLLTIPEPAHIHAQTTHLADPAPMSPDEMLRQHAAKRAANRTSGSGSASLTSLSPGS
jgi:hypothetical protein